MSLVIKNCKLESNGRVVVRDILVEDGKIKEITSQPREADQMINAKGQFAIPGLIDCHVHFREPGLSHKEGWKTGSYAAAAGGVTTVLDMPNTKPPTLTKKLLDAKRELAKKSVVNYGFHFGASLRNSAEIRKVNGNVASTKLYMNHTTGELMVNDKKAIERIFASAKMVTAHAEEGTAFEAIQYAQKAKKRLHLAHLSCKREMEFLEKYKTNGVSAEVTPHHLFLDKNSVKKMGAFALMKPELKSRKDVAALWGGVKRGLVDTIGTDHAPHTREEKKDAVFGVPGLETMLPLLLDAMNKGRLSLTKIVELTAKNPAKIFGIKNKGQLAPGFDADIVLVDVKLRKRVRDEHLFTKCGWSPFNGWRLKGWPTTTIVNGNVVFKDGNVFPNKGREVAYVQG